MHSLQSIPRSFFIKYLKGQNCERAVLRSCGSRAWSVKIKGRRFEDGWEEFARDHDLYVGDVLVFRHGGNMVFDVMVFDTRSACQRECPLFAMKGKDQKNSSAKRFGKQLEKCTSASFNHEHPYFVTTLKPDHLKGSKLNIPRKFARSNGLTDRFCEMVLVDQQGRSWIANLRHKKSEGQVYIGRGWRNLCIANNPKEEDSVLLELIGNGKKPEVARDSSAKTKPNHTDSKAGNLSCFCEGSSSETWFPENMYWAKMLFPVPCISCESQSVQLESYMEPVKRSYKTYKQRVVNSLSGFFFCWKKKRY